MVYIIIAAIVVMALLLGLGRSLFGDIIHLISAIAAFILAFVFSPQVSAALASFLKPVLEQSVSLEPATEGILRSIVSPLSFTLVFIVLFTVIGLITHIISEFIRPEKKPKFLPKLIINLLSGLLIAYALLVPAGYYPHKAGAIDRYVTTINDSISTADLLPGEISLPETIYGPVLNRITAAPVSLDDFTGFLQDLDTLDFSNLDTRSQLIEQLKASPEKDEMCGNIVSMTYEKFIDSTDRRIMKEKGRMSTKLDAMLVMTQYNSIIRMYPDANETTLSAMLRSADSETYDFAAGLLDENDLRVFHPYLGNNAPLIAQIFREIGTFADRSDAAIAREAEALAYLLSPKGNYPNLPLNYPKLDAAKVAGCISSSTILQNAFISITEGGSVFDPCRMKGTAYSASASKILNALNSKYGLAADSQLYRSLMAYFGLGGN
ncbi:MAG: CvpA family protein [Erysipelotrichaceae bacterium]|nr:CvpA family protein [Erysipelotrichaceae bacterium]